MPAMLNTTKPVHNGSNSKVIETTSNTSFRHVVQTATSRWSGSGQGRSYQQKRTRHLHNAKEGLQNQEEMRTRLACTKLAM
eukprot:6456990-Amphidinium_carterae.1